MLSRLYHYFKNIGIGLDQTLNAATGGDPDETLSSQVAKAEDYIAQGQTQGRWRRWSRFARVMEFFGIPHAHWENSIEDDEGRKN